MATTLMCACGANDAVIGGRCGPCHTDHVAAQRAAQKAMDQARIEARRRGRPSWRPSTDARNHGHGTERVR